MIVMFFAFVAMGVFWLRLEDVRERWSIDDWIDRWEPPGWGRRKG